MKKITLIPKAKKFTIIAGIAAVCVCVGVLSFVLLQHADAKSEKLPAVSFAVSSTVSSSAGSTVSSSVSIAVSTSASLAGSASSAISGTSSGAASGSANPSTTAAQQTGAANNDKATVRANSNNDGSGTTGSPKGSGSTGNKSAETTPAVPTKPSGGTPIPTPTPTPKAPDVPTVTPYNISADQQAVIAYGRSKGLTYNPNLRPENTTWHGRDDLLIDVASDNDIIKSGKDDIDGMLRVGLDGADFYPYFEKKSSKTNDYYFYVLWG